MKSRYITLLLIINLVSSFNVIGQRRLKNKDIYNFEIGSIIHFSHESNFEVFSRFTKRTFLSKQYALDQDSVTYIVLDSVYELVAIPTFKLFVKYDTLIYVNLDSFPSEYIDDSILNDCGTVVNFADYSVKPAGISYYELFRDVYVEGLGRYFLYEIDSDNTRSESTSLKYYKTQNKECGTRIGNLGILSNYRNKLSIYPNPVQTVIQIKNNSQEQVFEIYNIWGERLLVGIYDNAINVSSLSPGIYFIKLIDNGNFNILQFVKY